jgi:hypothetical protein
MIVRAQAKNGYITALEIGIGNALRYFSRDNRVIELQIDHLRIQCELPVDFWAATPEICDRRLCAWLQVKRHSSRNACFSLDMRPSGDNLFQLKPAPGSRHGKISSRLRRPL